MPLRNTELTAPRDFAGGTDGFVGPINHTVSVPVDLTQMTNKEIDADGYLKPYIPLTKAGDLIGVGDDLFGVTVEHVKVADDNESATIAALGTQDIAVVTTAVQLNQDIAEDVLDRVYNANELTAFGASLIVLL